MNYNYKFLNNSVCPICGKHRDVHETDSKLLPTKIVTCDECEGKKFEPYEILVGAVMNHSIDYTKGFASANRRNLKACGKTAENLIKDRVAFLRDFISTYGVEVDVPDAVEEQTAM
jgi:hypothetical protein